MLKYVLPGVELMPDKLSLRMLRIFTKSIPDFHKMDYHAEVRLSTSVPEVTAGTNTAPSSEMSWPTMRS